MSICLFEFVHNVHPGSGKTLFILMSIALYNAGTMTILILPLVAMHKKYKFRA
jgi:hypothetical protein